MGAADVAVPDFRGRQALDAWLAGHDAGVLCQGPDPDSERAILHGRVAAQHPPPGTRLPRWAPVTLWVRDDDGSAGVREPRRPLPQDRSLQPGRVRPLTPDEGAARS